jgi:hypothetical protein
MDPLSLLGRLATSVPPPRFHTVKYAGVLAPASAWRARIAPRAKAAACATDDTAKPIAAESSKRAGSTYRPWAELLARTFAFDVLQCPKCRGRMKLLALVKDPKQISRFLTHLGEPTDTPRRAPNRGPPFWKSSFSGRAHCSVNGRSVRWRRKGGSRRAEADVRPQASAASKNRPIRRYHRLGRAKWPSVESS